MDQNAAPRPTTGIKREIVYRIQIALFWYLCMLLSNTILQPVTDGVLYFTVSALFELFTIQAMRGLFGDTPLIRDANELNFYAFLIHLAAIPLYLSDVSSSYHNNALNGMILLYLIRLFYFSENQSTHEYKGWKTFGALGFAYRLVMKHGNGPVTRHLVYIGKVVIALGTVIPLWLVTIQTNDQQTSLFTILTTSFILIYGYWKSAMADQPAAGLVVQAPAGKSVSATTRARVLRLLRRAKREVAAMRSHINFLYIASALIISMLLFVGIVTTERNIIFSYATGFIDGKTGKAPRTEADIQKIVRCYNRDSAKPLPPNDECAGIYNLRPNQ